MPFPLDFITEALATAPSTKGPASFSGITTDSRSLKPGELFVALKGDKFDAHAFIADVVEKGATGVVCRRDFDAKGHDARAAFFRVDDTLAAFRRLGGAWRARLAIPVIAVAGAVGKTTTKELLAACLRGKFSRVLKTEGSFNGFVGIPMTLLRLSPEDRAAVIEIGIDDIGAMQQHLELVRPTAAIVTGIAEEHLEHLKDLATVAREESLALRHVAREGGIAAVNLDDPWLAPLAEEPAFARAIPYGLGKPGKGVSATHDPDRGTITVTGQGLREATFSIPLPGAHNARNLLGAVTVAAALGLDASAIQTGLSTFQPPTGRSQLASLGGVTVLCDYYNASPSSMRAGIEMLAAEARRASGTSWACLADMLELGGEELRYHRELAEPLVRAGVKHILLYGPRMRALRDELAARRYPGRVAHFEDIAVLGDTVASEVRPGDVALVKGSRSMKMERVFQALQARIPAVHTPHAGKPGV